mmetsp:Transcript_16213/g.52901  ORF Transcript_16213/g.52901 Transcript_16213/m.52901 type:complete len:251 (+) Transcript_16213:1524-2276(+)
MAACALLNAAAASGDPSSDVIMTSSSWLNAPLRSFASATVIAFMPLQSPRRPMGQSAWSSWSTARRDFFRTAYCRIDSPLTGFTWFTSVRWSRSAARSARGWSSVARATSWFSASYHAGTRLPTPMVLKIVPLQNAKPRRLSATSFVVAWRVTTSFSRGRDASDRSQTSTVFCSAAMARSRAAGAKQRFCTRPSMAIVAVRASLATSKTATRQSTRPTARTASSWLSATAYTKASWTVSKRAAMWSPSTA